MATPAITSSTPTPPDANASTKAQKQLTSNFDTFLTLLTAQLRSQDPLKPLDSNEFTQQLVQFSQVEQQIASNQNLENLLTLVKAQGAGTAVSYLGKTVTLTDGKAALDDGHAEWSYTLPRNAASNRITIEDAKGRTVYFQEGATSSGAHAFAWNGNNNAGAALPPGTYTLKTGAKAADGTAITGSVSSRGTVTGVDLGATEPLLMIGPMPVPLGKATLISAN
jgi:flagellar basal-body rod modification protein FlgD